MGVNPKKVTVKQLLKLQFLQRVEI